MHPFTSDGHAVINAPIVQSQLACTKCVLVFWLPWRKDCSFHDYKICAGKCSVNLDLLIFFSHRRLIMPRQELFIAPIKMGYCVDIQALLPTQAGSKIMVPAVSIGIRKKVRVKVNLNIFQKNQFEQNFFIFIGQPLDV